MADTDAALATAVVSMDAARRVGWAKAYAAQEQADDVSRDLNIARGDLAAVSKFAAFMYGVVLAAVPQAAEKLPRMDRVAIRSMLPDAQLRAGRAAGRKALGDINPNINQLKARLEAERSLTSDLCGVIAGELDSDEVTPAMRKLRRENAVLRLKLRAYQKEEQS